MTLPNLGVALTGFRAWSKLTVKATAAFRVELIVSLLDWVVPLAFMALWNTAAASSGIMSPGQTTTYYLVQLVTSNLSLSGSLIFGLGPLVYSGELSVLLLMPLPPIIPLATESIVNRLIRSAPLVVAVPLMAWFMKAGSSADWRSVLLASVLGLLGWSAATLAAAVYALSTFWFGKWGGIMGLFIGLQWVLAGLIAPSPFLPDWLAWSMRLSPLWAAQGGLAELLSGVVAFQWWMFPVVLGWIAVLLAAWRWAWTRALRRFEAVGM
ncbi:MAG: ABC-2 family transporter protein [Propionibacteriaceae bacterium]|jgi:ABC-type uncharacterized transport system permease subunit|nr:ABC-2 family transporter protein [Propionibacteriaceae bacterium]